MKSFICDICNKSFTLNHNLTRHIKNVHQVQVFECITCHRKYKRSDNLKHHQNLMQGRCSPNTPPAPSRSTALPSTSLAAPCTSSGASGAAVEPTVISIYCSACRRNVEKKCWTYHQRTNDHKRNSGFPLNDNFKTLRTGFTERIETLYYENKNEAELNTDKFLEEVKIPLIQLLRELLIKHTSIKLNIELFAEYIKMTDESAMIDIKSHQTKMTPVLQSTEIDSILNNMYGDINTKMSEFQERDSGWTLIKLLHLEININQYHPLRGSTYIKLPAKIESKHACINIQNNDIYCFKWAIISAVKPITKNTQRCDSYNIKSILEDIIEITDANIILNFSNLTFPLSVRDINKFEQQNHSVSINVFGYDNELKKIVGPYYITKEEKKHHINLLLLQEEEKSHYVWIKDISR